MKRLIVLPIVMAAGPLLGMGVCDARPPDSELRAGISEAELAAEPGYHEMKAALLSDVRIWRELHKRLDEGARTCAALKYVEGLPLCAVDDTEFEVYRLKNDLQDQPYRVDEAAYYCRKEGVYYYHYQGGPRRLSVWLGPFRIERKRVKPDTDR